MTDKEIRNMPAGREMRLLIAERVFNWKLVEVPPDINHENGGRVLVSSSMHTLIESAEYKFNPLGQINEAFFVKDWDTDIVAAMEVVAEMQGRNYWFFCGILSSYSRARFIPATPYEPKDTEVSAGVDELSLAICRAALLAMEAKWISKS